MSISQANVETLAKESFPNHDVSVILSILDEYGNANYERERERVQIAILKLSDGDEGKLLHYVAAAKQDYRDVLMWAEEPPPTLEQIVANQAAVDLVLRHFGKK